MITEEIKNRVVDPGRIGRIRIRPYDNRSGSGSKLFQNTDPQPPFHPTIKNVLIAEQTLFTRFDLFLRGRD